jgi:hypothetical protein
MLNENGEDHIQPMAMEENIRNSFGEEVPVHGIPSRVPMRRNWIEQPVGEESLHESQAWNRDREQLKDHGPKI